MKILLYATNTALSLDLEERITKRLAGCKVTVCSSFENMNESLPGIHAFSAVVFVVATREELLELLTLQKMLVNTKIILVLPDYSETLIRSALKLYPRYITDQGQCFNALTDVLEKIGSALNGPADSYQFDHRKTILSDDKVS